MFSKENGFVFFFLNRDSLVSDHINPARHAENFSLPFKNLALWIDASQPNASNYGIDFFLQLKSPQKSTKQLSLEAHLHSSALLLLISVAFTTNNTNQRGF